MAYKRKHNNEDDYDEVVTALKNFNNSEDEEENDPSVNFINFLDYQTGGNTQDIIDTIGDMLNDAYAKLGYDNDKAYEIEDLLDNIYFDICDGKFNFDETMEAIKLFQETFSIIFEQWFYPPQLVRCISILEMMCNEDIKNSKFLEIKKYLFENVFPECRTVYYGTK